MSFESFNPFKKKENRYLSEKEKEKKGKEKKKDDFDPGRREFLKKGGAAAGGLALSGVLGNLLKEKLEEMGEKEIEKEEKEKEETREKEEPSPTPEQKEIEQENVISLTEILDYDKEGRIELTSETMEAIKNHWKEKYRNVTELKDSLEGGYKRMGEWESYVEEQFRQEGIPEKYKYLALPESHWQIEARSPKKAVGPYQFTPTTARKYGLNTNHFADQHPNLEERKDPIKASDACARLLKDLYEAGKDWDLALAGYNGGYIWEYLNKAYGNGEEISYNDFLKHLEEKINNIKEEIRSRDHDSYQIEKGDTLKTIADKFNMETEELVRVNNIENKNRIYVGQKLKIPITEETKKKLFEERINGMAENLNYPPKFNAIHELIEEGFVQEQKEPLSFETIKAGSGYEMHTFRKEDKNIYRLAQKFSKVSAEEILKANPDIDPKKLSPGEKIRIPSQNSSNTLRDIAASRQTDLTRLQELNPAVEDAGKPLPPNYEIRIPTSTLASK